VAEEVLSFHGGLCVEESVSLLAPELIFFNFSTPSI